MFKPNGWARTGSTFRVWDDDASSLSTVCRFWSGPSFAPKSSHFYTPDAGELLFARGRNDVVVRGQHLQPTEGDAGSRICAPDSQPLYRLYNNGAGGAPNHRYTTSLQTLSEMVGKGWTIEGEAKTKVFACVSIQ